jgi:hypothetical protein
MRIIAITASYSGLQDLMPVAELQAIVSSAVSHWNSGLEHCCAVRFEVMPPVSNWLAVGDKTNLIALRRQYWCHNERCGNRSTFPLGTLAITSAYPEHVWGNQLHEADIEVDARQLRPMATLSESFRSIEGLLRTSSGYWVLARQGDPSAVPLEVVLTHELGHVLGINDVCVSGYRVGGQPILGHCGDEQRTRIMYADARVLKPNEADLAEVAKLYPVNLSDINHTNICNYWGLHMIFALALFLSCGTVVWTLFRRRK